MNTAGPSPTLLHLKKKFNKLNTKNQFLLQTTKEVPFKYSAGIDPSNEKPFQYVVHLHGDNDYLISSLKIDAGFHLNFSKLKVLERIVSQCIKDIGEEHQQGAPVSENLCLTLLIEVTDKTICENVRAQWVWTQTTSTQ